EQTLSSMQVQSRLGDQVASGIEQIHSETSGTTKAAEQTSRIATDLVSMAAQLNSLVSQFKL
ncbi:MAG: hypothetical protein ACPGYX_08260, partial [Oceanobacter sp.]